MLATFPWKEKYFRHSSATYNKPWTTALCFVRAKKKPIRTF